MKKFLLCAALAAGIGAAACGGSSSSSNDSGTNTVPNTNTNTTTDTTGTHTFAGSCMMVTSMSAGTMTITVTVCTDFNDDTAAAVQAGCQSGGGSSMTTTYSADHCPTTNMLGKCTTPTTGNVNYYYAGGSDTKTSDQTACYKSGGTWSDT